MHKRWPVRMYLWLLALAVALPCAVVLIYSIAADARQDRRRVETTTLSLAQLVASQTELFLSDAANLAAKLSQRQAIRALSTETRDPMFDQFLDLNPQFANLVVCDNNGRIIHSAVAGSAETPLQSIRAQWSDEVLRTGRFTVTKPIFGQLTHRYVCVLGHPVKDLSGHRAGALGMSVDLARFNIPISPVNLPEDSTITIIDNEGTIIMRSPGSRTWVGKNIRDMEIVELALLRKEGKAVARGLDGAERIYGFSAIPSVGWHVYVGIPQRFAAGTARSNTVRASITAAAVLILILGLVLFVGRLINEPVSALFRAATAVAEGKIPPPVPATGPREIASVAAEFNRMLAARQQKEQEIQKLNLELEQRVKQRTAELEKTNLELQREVAERKRIQQALEAHELELQDYIDGMSTMNAKVALDGTILLVNKTTQQAAGLPLEQLMKTNFLEGHWWSFDPQVQARVRQAFAKACGGSSINYDEKLFVFGKVIDINFTLVPVQGGDGNVAYLVAEAREITARKQAEAALAERTLQLEGANKELEAFAYSVSHDLRAPLRGIDGFTKALQEDFGERLDDEGKHYLERVRAATHRMAQLIDDLLQLSRISRSQLRHEQVDLTALANQIAGALQEGAPARQAEFSVESGLVANGDARLLRLVLDNLLNNAWKFTRHRAPARIELGAEKIDGQTAFFVRDNGAGFDMTYADKLFGAFQRLHSAEEYEGTGIGLATVQRIIHRHGGRVWGQGRVEEGATFFFTLPV